MDPAKRELINEIIDQEDGIRMATEELLLISKDENMRFQLEHELKNMLDYKDGMLESKREGYKEAEELYAGIIQEKDTALQEKDRALQEKDQVIAELMQKLGRLEPKAE
jgi:hypothetical protein